MSLSDLTEGAINHMINGSETNKIKDAVCQVLSIKKIAPSNPGNAERYRIILSDGQNYCQSMLAMQLGNMVESGVIERNVLLRVTEYAANNIQSRRILIILGVERFADPTENRLGNPANIDSVSSATASNVGEASNSNAKPAAAPAQPEPRDVKPNYGARNGSSKSESKPAYGTSVGGTKSNLPLYPIEGLSPYQNKWTIRARVTMKGDIKHWSKPSNSGKLFSVNLLDESGEIRATGFGDEVDKFYNLLQENKVYYISKAKVVIAKKQFSNLPNDYELQFKGDTEIEECTDASSVPTVQYNFIPLNELDAVEVGQSCDVIGVVTNIGELGEITSKATGNVIPKRELTLADSTGMSVRVTLWGKNAENFRTDEDHPVMGFKGLKVGDFNGRSLSMQSGSSMSMNLEIDEAFALKGWYEAEGNKSNFKSYSRIGTGLGGSDGLSAGPGAVPLSQRKTIAQIKEEGLGLNEDKPDYCTFKATLVYVKQENLYYTACAGDGCQKKVTLMGDEWRCEKCNRSYETCNHRYIMTANVSDHTGQLWIQAFNDQAEQMLGISANELAEIRERDADEYAQTIKKKMGTTWVFGARAKQETFNDNTRMRYTITKIAPNDFVKEGNLLAEAIEKYL